MPPPVPKKRKLTTTATEKIDFDFSAREEYLTGFHKRKVARAKHAQEENAKREKEEKLRFRRELREQRKVDLQAHVLEVNRLVAQANGDLDQTLGTLDPSDGEEEEEFTGFAEPDPINNPEPINEQDEYIDEEKYTTVTVESVNISKAGFHTPGQETAEEAAAQKHKEEKEKEEAESKKRVWTKEWPRNSTGPKKKKKKFRYETKVERKEERMKQGAKKRKQKEARTSKAA